MGFGGFETRDLSVQMLLDLNKGFLLVNAYFHLEKIDFTEDILLELGITEEFRIPKPGKDYNKCKEFKNYKYQSLSDLDRIKLASKINKDLKMETSRSRKRRTGNSAEYLRSKNHGNKH